VSDEVLTWVREGGIAIFCDELRISAAGEIITASCGASATRTGGLSKEDLNRLSSWRSVFGAVVIKTKDSPESGVSKSLGDDTNSWHPA